jgi:hypothetical protein
LVNNKRSKKNSGSILLIGLLSFCSNQLIADIFQQIGQKIVQGGQQVGQAIGQSTVGKTVTQGAQAVNKYVGQPIATGVTTAAKPF